MDRALPLELACVASPLNAAHAPHSQALAVGRLRLQRPRALLRRSAPALLAALALGAAPAASAAFTCATADDASTCAALGALFAALNGGGWKASSAAGWSAAAAGTPTPFCTFQGVQCSGSQLASLCAARSRSGRAAPVLTHRRRAVRCALQGCV